MKLIFKKVGDRLIKPSLLDSIFLNAIYIDEI
jgi:hypothetical protein